MESNTKQEITILTWNPDTLPRKRTEELQYLITLTNADIILLQETGWKAHHNFTTPEYTIYRQDRTTGRGGGCATIVKNSIPSLPATMNMQAEAAAATIFLPQPIDIVSTYMKTNQLKKQDLEELTRRRPTIIGGDLNAKHLELGSPVTNNNGRCLLSFQQKEDKFHLFHLC